MKRIQSKVKKFGLQSLESPWPTRKEPVCLLRCLLDNSGRRLSWRRLGSSEVGPAHQHTGHIPATQLSPSRLFTPWKQLQTHNRHRGELWEGSSEGHWATGPMKNVTHLVLKRHIWGGSVSALYPPSPPQPLFTCTGETLLEDVSAAHVAPGVLAPGFEVVTLSGFLLHPGVLLPRWEDGPHVRRSEPSPPAPQRPSPEVTFHPVIGCICLGVLPLGTRYRLGGLSTLGPGRLQALKTGGLWWRMPPDSLHHHRALVGFGDPHSGPRRRPGALRSFVEPPRGRADATRLECRVIRDRTACRDVLPTEVHHARASLPAEPRESSECDVVLMTPVMTPARAWRRSACCLWVNRLRWWCVQGAAEQCKETTILKSIYRKIIPQPD